VVAAAALNQDFPTVSVYSPANSEMSQTMSLPTQGLVSFKNVFRTVDLVN